MKIQSAITAYLEAAELENYFSDFFLLLWTNTKRKDT